MPWTRTGDNAATYPKLMAVMGQADADERIVNEVAGWLFRCAFQSAAHMTDYVIDVGTAFMLGGTRTQTLVALATRAGLITPTTADGVQAFKIIEDPEFIHIRLRKEVEWERQQRKDTRDPRLKAPVMYRDGDNCRYCGVGVQWLGQRTNRSATLDHVQPGEAGTVDTMVVACQGCNGARQDNPQWDADNPLRPAPGQPGAYLAAPNYGRYAVKYLTQHGYAVEQTYGSSERPATAPATDPAPRQGVRPSAAADAVAAPDAPRVDEESAKESAPSTDEMTLTGSGRDGTGRVGTGQGGSGRDGTGTDGSRPRAGAPPRTRPQQTKKKPRRGRRGGRR